MAVANGKLASVPFWVPLREGRNAGERKLERKSNFELTQSGNSSVKDEVCRKKNGEY